MGVLVEHGIFSTKKAFKEAELIDHTVFGKPVHVDQNNPNPIETTITFTVNKKPKVKHHIKRKK